ncbi:MAG: FtsX-like permease family protein [Acidimicrobiia bacterium]|nr:FtsX-like permease family protein [Acidimicrobiia bacterium]
MPIELRRSRGRVPIGRRLVLRSRSRFAMAVVACTAVIALIVVELSVHAGLLGATSWLDAMGSEAWVMVAGGKVLSQNAPLPDAVVAQAREAGFAASAAVAFTPCEMASAGGELQTAMAVSWPASAFGLDVTAGRSPQDLDESVIDEAVARSMGIGVGSGLRLKRGSHVRDTVVVGTVAGTSTLIQQWVFVTAETGSALLSGDPDSSARLDASAASLNDLETALRDAAAKLREILPNVGLFTEQFERLRSGIEQLEATASSAADGSAALIRLREQLQPDKPQYLAIRLREGQSVSDVRRALGGSGTDVSVLTAAEFREDLNTKYFRAIEPLVTILVAAAVAVGVLLLGLTLSTQVSESLADYAVLRAIGYGRGGLRRLVLAQSCYLIGISLVLGLGLGIAVTALIGELAPLIPWRLVPSTFAIATAAAVVMGLLGSLAPLRRALRLDPVSVMRR